MELRDIVEKVLTHNFPECNIQRKPYNIRCNVCGDSKSNKNKKRGYILLEDNKGTFYCHRCNASISIQHWLKEFFPTYFQEYIKNRYFNKKFEDETLVINRSNDDYEEKLTIYKSYAFDKPNFNDLIRDNKDMKTFVPIIDDHIQWCKNRKIPEEYYNSFYSCTKKSFKNRIVIPFYEGESIYYFQARTTLKDVLPKYKNPISEIRPLYNIFNVDTSKPVLIVEGPIDAMFLPNCIAVCGSNLSVLDQLDNRYYILDNDAVGSKKAIDLLMQKQYVFMWKKFLRDIGMLGRDIKDINDLILKGINREELSFNNLEQYFTNNLYMKGMC